MMSEEDKRDELPAKIETVLEQLPPAQRREVEVVMRQMVARYSGPVPPASEMRRYKEVDPTFPERFVRLAEKQVSHRHSMEEMVFRNDFKLKRRGQDYALISVFAGMAFALIFALIGQPIVAAVVGGTTVVGVVTAFVVGRVTEARSDEDEENEE